MALVTESAATNKSFLKLRFPLDIDPLVHVFKFDILTGVPLKYILYLNYFYYPKKYNYITC